MRLLIDDFLEGGHFFFYLIGQHNIFFEELTFHIKSIDCFRLTTFGLLDTYSTPIILLLRIIIQLNQLFLYSIEKLDLSSKVLLLVLMVHQLEHVFHLRV